MSSAKIIGSPLPNIPWEDRPEGCSDVVWRYSGNPIIPRNATPTSNSVFNSAAVPYQGRFAGVFRADTRTRHMQLNAGFSDDGYHWRINPDPIQWILDDPELEYPHYLYDPRVCWIEDRYWVTWCNGFHGPTIGIGYTRDFQEFHFLENAYVPFNRNGVLFPRKINGRYMMLNRPSDNGHTPFGEIFLSQSEDMIHWGRHRWVMRPQQAWESTKIGPGPVPIETTEGWLMFHHGVLTSCNGFVYAWGATLLDLEKPWKVIARGAPYLIAPWMPYEQVGDVPNVTFPCAALADADTGRITVYYGCADTVTGLAFCKVDEVVDWVRKNQA
jgi:beta-1,4-mannooligosaccharide/beta-1,4-mannosyl-N-acetylglucosamine phosphorylase